MKSQICIACGGTNFCSEPSVLRGVSLQECRQCGTGFTHSVPPQIELEQQYAETYYGPQNVKFVPLMERAVQWNAYRRARWISRLLKPRSRVLDVGCGRGTLLEGLAKLGHECYGTERSEFAAKKLVKTRMLGAACLLVLSAFVFSLIEAAFGKGGVLRVLAQKPHK